MNRLVLISCLLVVAFVPCRGGEADSTAVDSSKAMSFFSFKRERKASMESFGCDSLRLIGSRYISLGEIVELSAGGWQRQTGSPGQPVFISLFGKTPGKMTLTFDELVLDHPLSGKADLNWIPVESAGRIGAIHRSDDPFAWLPAGASLAVRSMSLADNPIRSQVAYRTGGAGYDDVDARLGAKFSDRLWLDLGGAVRAYNGHMPNSLYDGHQIDVRLNRRIRNDWLLRCLVLVNDHSTHIPLPRPAPGFEQVRSPLQKEKRNDFAAVLRLRNRFLTVVQYTVMDSDLRDERRSLFNDRRDVRAVRWTTEWRPLEGRLNWYNGATARHIFLQGSSWGKHMQGDLAAYSAGELLFERTSLGARMTIEKNEAAEIYALPEVHFFAWSKDSTRRAVLWANRLTEDPSLAERYSQGLLFWGNERLKAATHDQLGAAVEKRIDRLFVATAACLRKSSSPIGALEKRGRVEYANLPDALTATVDVLGEYQHGPWMISLKGEGYRAVRGLTPNDRPAWMLQGFLQSHIIAFKGDLNLQVRLGGYLVGPRRASKRYYTEYGGETIRILPQVYPYLHLLLHYRSADLFFSFENFLRTDLQAVSGYSMPKSWLRWGFVWHFVD